MKRTSSLPQRASPFVPSILILLYCFSVHMSIVSAFHAKHPNAPRLERPIIHVARHFVPSLFTTVKPPKTAFLSTRRRLSSSSERESSPMPALKILALHGKGGSGTQFENTVRPLSDAIRDRLSDRLDVRIDFLTAPFAGGQWWTLPDGVRSFNAERYDGYDESAALVKEALSCHGEESGYDIVLGHSQGAILLAAMIASGDVYHICGKQVENQNATHSVTPLGVILNGAAWPNPFTERVEAFRLEDRKSSPAALFCIGESDDINPPEGAIRVKEKLESGGMKISTCLHPAGHSIPTHDSDAIGNIVDWIQDLMKEKTVGTPEK